MSKFYMCSIVGIVLTAGLALADENKGRPVANAGAAAGPQPYLVIKVSGKCNTHTTAGSFTTSRDACQKAVEVAVKEPSFYVFVYQPPLPENLQQARLDSSIPNLSTICTSEGVKVPGWEIRIRQGKTVEQGGSFRNQADAVKEAARLLDQGKPAQIILVIKQPMKP